MLLGWRTREIDRILAGTNQWIMHGVGELSVRRALTLCSVHAKEIKIPCRPQKWPHGQRLGTLEFV
jgi:hypothetical protein